jgi:cell division septum initiation protein DivIVA
MSKIEQIIMEIEEYIDSCKYQPLSNTKIVVNKEEIEELLAELRLKTPDEIKKYQKIIANKEAILNDAKDKADTIIGQANAMTAELISEHEIMQQAYVQANEIVQKALNQAQDILDKATYDANEIRMGAIKYTDDILFNLQTLLSNTMDSFGMRYENLIKSLETSLKVVTTNREELYSEEESAGGEEEPVEEEQDFSENE